MVYFEDWFIQCTLNAIRLLNLHFACTISELCYVTSPKDQTRLDLLSCLDDKHFKDITGIQIKPVEIHQLTDDERLKLISMLAAKLPELAEKAYGEVDLHKSAMS